MMANEPDFKKALEGVELPILPLDNRWHRLFTQREKTPEIEELATQITALMGRQARLRDDEKKIKALKSKLMGRIIEVRERAINAGENSREEKSLEETTRLIGDCNDKLDEVRDEQIGIPRELRQKNLRLMVLSMEVCYRKLHKNSEVIEDIDRWLAEVRVQLKKNMIEKQEKETENFNLYSYMHDVFGAQVMEIFDITYDPEKQHPIRTPDINSMVGAENMVK